jgi:hypothetical protein
MIQMLVLAWALLQDPKGTPGTVEDRLKDLDAKLTVLEKKRRELADDNAAMEKKIADADAAREAMLRRASQAWIKHYGASFEPGEKQVADIDQLWYAWLKEDQGKPADAARWKAREQALREKLTPAQIPPLARMVREDQVRNAKASLTVYSQWSKLTPGKAAAFEKEILGRMRFEEGVLVPEAHPDQGSSWTTIPTIIESSLPELSALLTEDDQAALRKTLSRWKPRRP